jgi:hypothetical protein
MSIPLVTGNTYTLLASIGSGGCTTRYGIQPESPGIQCIRMSASVTSTASLTIIDSDARIVSIQVGNNSLAWFLQYGVFKLAWSDQLSSPVPAQFKFVLSELVANQPLNLLPSLPYLNKNSQSFMLLSNKPPHNQMEVAFGTYGSLGNAAGFVWRDIVPLTWTFYTQYPVELVSHIDPCCLPKCADVVCAAAPCNC